MYTGSLFYCLEIMVSEHQFDPEVISAVRSAHTAVNVITYFLLFLAVFAGVMLGVFNAADDTTTEGFVMGFAAIFFLLSIPAIVTCWLVKRCIAHPEPWKQAVVWTYCLLLIPVFPLGTGGAIAILYGQIKWMRAP